MTRMIKAISIDPFACTVTEVEYDAENYQNIYPLLSHPIHPVECFTIAPTDILKGADALFVDDNGLLNGPVRFFALAGSPQPYAGKGLIVGTDDEGESQSCQTRAELIRMCVMFLERCNGGLIEVTWPLRNDPSK